ncbi:tetratricopeptide repeat protein [Candidatus Poribacteria bacterium]|nr:tetratricopeptide repeat protein [Candidatus Poribacteria bacterium]
MSMNNPPILYIGIAAPFVEAARVWLAEIPPYQDERERREKLKQFPYATVGAYGIYSPDASVIAFRTGLRVSEERVQKEIEQWSGKPPKLLHKLVNPIGPLDYRKALEELKQALSEQPIRIVSRVGLTPQRLQRDLIELTPELMILDCHGSEEGCLLFEDGRACADMVPGERLFPMLEPRPKVLFLAACYSEAVLRRAQESADWQDAAILYVSGETPIEVAACVAFQSMFIPAFLRGRTAGDAFDAARRYVENDPKLGSLSVAPGAVSPADKFRINEKGKNVCMAGIAPETSIPSQEAKPTLQVGRLRRASERFVGRRREMARIIDGLLPQPAGINPGQERRIVTLTKEGGIGKTAIALEVSDWVCEREFFPGGIFELSGERLFNAQELLTRLLALFGVPLEEQRGDLFSLLSAVLPQKTSRRQTLLLLDNLDDLSGQHTLRDVRKDTEKILETILTVAPNLRILATCRWQLGLADHELELEMPPMVEDDARDVFLSHLDSPVHQLEARETWEQPNSAIRQLVKLSGRHPQSLRLLARQMRRPGTTIDRLRHEAYTDLMKVLTDPLATEDEDDRLKKVALSYEFSYRHLSENGKLMFERMARLPGGVWCGELAEQAIQWHELLEENWREIMERELDYFALVHFEPGDSGGGSGVFEMLTPMREFALKKYRAADHTQWEAKWLEFWRQRIQPWNQLISGELPEGIELPEAGRLAMGTLQRQIGVTLFEHTQPNWLALMEHALQRDVSLAHWLLLEIVSFCQLSGQNVLLKALSEAVVNVLRRSGQEEDLAPCLGTLGTVQSDLGEGEAARASYTEALEIYRRLAQRHPAAFEQYVATTLNNLGTVQRALGELQDARQSFTEALEIYRRLAQRHPAAFEQYVATTLNNLGTVQRDLGELQDARQSYTEALEIYFPLAIQLPAAFGRNFHVVLRNYTNVTPESPDDLWWQLWKNFAS